MSILALWVQDAGMRALKDLDTSLDQFIELMERKDKQDIPIKQQEALGFVSVIEEAMVKGFPYEVPKQYANLPQLKVERETHSCGAHMRGCNSVTHISMLLSSLALKVPKWLSRDVPQCKWTLS